MKNLCITLFLLIFIISCKKHPAPEATRTFTMGVTPWPADFTTEAVDDAYSFIRDHCDRVSHHFDEGIPYDEAYHNAPMPPALINDVQTRSGKTPAGMKVLLSVAALDITRHARAGYYQNDTGVSDSIKNYWLQLPFNDSQVVRAYVNYISYLVEALHPDMVNYGVESNYFHWDAASFDQYKDFISHSFTLLKIKYPSINFFVSFMVNEDPSALSLAAQLIPYSDYIGLSAYPYTSGSSDASGNTDPVNLPADYFTKFIDLAPSKPWGFAETGYIAQDLIIPSYNLNKHGRPEWQEAYLQKICNLLNERKGKFLIWFCQADYDAGCERLKQLGLYQDLFGLWKDIGFKDENGQLRPAFASWEAWKQRKLQ